MIIEVSRPDANNKNENRLFEAEFETIVVELKKMTQMEK
jgi:hypothetical protein